ncbi:MAG TPA: sulfite exporter TauE/SafE family protein [Vicinamibacteria bacterium]
MFEALLFLGSVAAGAIASVAGFGVGSLLTPLFTLAVDTRLAVAAVSIPHLFATSLRLWMMRRHVDWRLLRGFGLASAAGGLAGALLQSRARSRTLDLVLGGLLLLAGLGELTGLARRVRLRGKAAWLAGALSGVFGGLVGNQGGIRSAALLGFDVPRDAFVATATAIALAIDLARMPVYVAIEHARLIGVAPLVALATAGAIGGTLVGQRLLARIAEGVFRRVVAILLLALGAYMLARRG